MILHNQQESGNRNLGSWYQERRTGKMGDVGGWEMDSSIVNGYTRHQEFGS